MHRQVCTFFLLLTSVMALAAPAMAGTVYVSLASDTTVEGLDYESVLRVTNTGTAPHFFVIHFIPSFSDGTERGAEQLSPIGVPPGHTYVYENLSLGTGKAGMLEITGDDQLVFTASVVVRNANGDGESAPVPVVGSDQLVPAGQRIVIQGVRRDAQHLTSYGLLNLSQQPNQCEVDLFGANGAELISTAVLAMPPLSQFFWHDVVQVAGLASAADARFEAVCAGPAFAFGKVINFASGDVAPIQPSSSLFSTLVPPGKQPAVTPDPPPGECGGDFCYELPGTFFVPNPSDRVRKLQVPIPKGEFYSRLEIEMTVVHGGWFAGNPGGFHNFFWFFDGKWSGGSWGYVNARGPGKEIVTSAHFINIPQSRRTAASLLLQPGATYRVRYVYDAAAGFVNTTFYDAGGAVLADLRDAAGARRIVFGTDVGTWLWFGLEGHFEEVPSFGWQYKNFVLSLTK